MQGDSRTSTKRSWLLCLTLLGLAAALFILPQQFPSEANVQKGEGLIPRTESHDPEIPNYDIRTAKSDEASDALVAFRDAAGTNAAAIATTRDGFVRGEELLRTRIPHLKVEYNDGIRIPEVISPDVWRNSPEWLSTPTSGNRADVLRQFAKQNNQLIGVEPSQIDMLKTVADYTNPDGNLSYAVLDQEINGIPVFAGTIKAGFTKNGEIIRVINNLAPGLDYSSLSTDFRDPADAVRVAAANIKHTLRTWETTPNAAASTDIKVVFGEGDWATTAEKMYFPTEPGVARAAWRVMIILPTNGYYVIVDAETGTVLWRKNLAEDQTQSATYEVYTNPTAYMNAANSPAPFSPGPIDPTAGQQAPLITRTNVTLIGNEGDLSFNNNGWITDGDNITDGNANEAGLDRVSPDGVDAPMQGDGTCPGSGCRVFSSTWNPPPGNPAPGDAPTDLQAQRGAVIQMFYVMNLYHDELYKRGFTEQAFNFQHDNFGRGGTAGDRVRSEGQDFAGTNNATFLTPADGGRGRMQMYVWTGPNPDRDGTTDAEVIIHEVTHGTSNRLHGNTAGLSGNMARGMGEGWGDWYGHTMLAHPTDPINSISATGGYVTHLITAGFNASYYYGIRRFPKAVMAFTGGPGNLPHNPLTFANLNSGNCSTFNSAFPRGPVGSATDCDQVHNAGEIWSSALWEVRALMVTRLGFQAGTEQALQVVTDGMKLAPLNPTFLQERDAIIAAANALTPGDPAAANDVREGFRIRGMGFFAEVISASPAVVVESFDPANALVADPITMSDAPGDADGFPEPGENVTVSVPVANNTGAPVTNVVVSVTGGGSVNYGTINDGATVTNDIPLTIASDAECGSMYDVEVNLTSDAGTNAPRTEDFRLGAPVGGAPITFTNSTQIDVPGGQPSTTSGPSNPYPSNISVSGLSGRKLIRVTLHGFEHEWYDDVDLLLVGPGGQKYIFMSDSGGGSTENEPGKTFSIFDGAAEPLPDGNGIVDGGEYRPANYQSGDTFDAPAPAGPYQSAAPIGSDTFESVFGTDGATMNGTWALYGDDDAGSDPGFISGGWSITFESDEYVCSVGPSAPSDSRADFDGDGRTDVSVFRGSEGNWYLNQSTDGFAGINFGLASDVLTPGDYDGDGKADVAVFRADASGTDPDFYVLKSSDFTVFGASWGTTGDVPVTGDYDGDGSDDFAVYRESDLTWYILTQTGSTIFTPYGEAGDTPAPADYDGDGTTDLSVHGGGSWSGILSGGGVFDVSFGSAGDVHVPGDYDGDGSTDLAVYRPSDGTWYIINSGNGTTSAIPFGISTDVPVPGDYDGDGSEDVAVYRDGIWWILGSTDGVSAVAFGISTDDPIVAAARP